MVFDFVGVLGRRLSVVPLGFLLLAVGCVPYSVHQQTKEDLIKAKDANADLIKKYNSAVQQLMSLKDKPGAMTAGYPDLRDEVERLKSELANKVRPDFTPEEIERVGGVEEEGGLAIGDALLFAEGSAKLKREAFPILDKLVSILSKEHPSEPIVIEGHTDNQPLNVTIKEFGDNLTLGYARAHAVGSYLMSKGIAESRMVVTSYSFNKPLNKNNASTKQGREQNRRVVVRLSTLKL